MYYSSVSFSDASQINSAEFLNQSTIKLAGKLKDKHNLFLSVNGKKHPYSTLEHVRGRPFVIAVAPFDNHLSYAQNNMAINRVLYGINPPVLKGDRRMVVEETDHILNHNGQRIELGIFTNESYKEISAVIFSTTGMFGKAVVQAQISSFIRATRYRQMDMAEFMDKEGPDMLGKTHRQITQGYDVFSIRFIDGSSVCGSDIYLYNSAEHNETHLDGLHIYYNPYASVPLDDDLLAAYEITQNNYDIKERQMVCKHNDGSLVSRQTYTSLA